MSPREKKLLTLFALAGFIILNFVAIRFFIDKRMSVKAARTEAVRQLDTAEMFAASKNDVIDEMEWLSQHEPTPTPHQEVETELLEMVAREANAAGLTIKPSSQKIQPVDEKGPHYHRAKMVISVTGMENSLYRWLDRLNSPEDFRTVTTIRLSPNREDDTKIDCTATFEKWFVPPPSA